MNEVVYIYLKLGNVKEEELDELINRMDEMLLPIGLKYSGIHNMYIPQDYKRRDDIVFDAIHMLETCDWLKGIYDYAMTGSRCFNKDLNAIDCSGMIPPKGSKIAYYEEYYLKTNELPHGILVDENDCLTDGYISYLIAQKYNLRQNTFKGPEVYRVESEVPHEKIVEGRHVAFGKDDIIIKSEKRYRWICDIKAPVVPGDVLLVRTGKGKAFMMVDKIVYEAGNKNLSVFKNVIKHTGKKVERKVHSNKEDRS